MGSSFMHQEEGESPCSLVVDVGTYHLLSVDFSYCWINLEDLKYSLEQYIGFAVRQAFNYYCSLHQVWREAEN